MNIVVYGCDNSGKTSLANHITEKFNFEYVRSKGGPKMESQEVLNYLEENLTSPANKVFDRFSIIEEYANGLVLRGKDRFQEEFRDKNHFMDQVDLFIYACPSMETVKNFGDREQMAGIVENIEKLRVMYEIFTLNEVAVAGRNLFIFDWTKDPSYSKFDAWLEAFIMNQARIKDLVNLN